jgi:hypothetical protein
MMRSNAGVRLLVLSMSLFVLMGAVLLPSSLQGAIVYDFSGSDPEHGGLGVAKMTVNSADTGTGWELIITIENLSPTVYDGYFNSPGITGFGLNFHSGYAQQALLNEWTLEALAYSLDDGFTTVDLRTISDGTWTLAEYQSGPGQSNNYEGVKLDFIAHQDSASSGALYNPAWASLDEPGLPYGGQPHFYTTAILTLQMDGALPDDLSDVVYLSSSNQNPSPFVRMHHVGEGGEGSLKLNGIPQDPFEPGPSAPVPEPGALAVWGLLGALGLGWGVRRRRLDAARE